MSNIMSLVKLQNKPSRNGYDLSRKVAMSAKMSELIPVDCIECIPGDSFKIRQQHFTRTLPVNSAAYTRIREYYDWFFVPTNLLWNKFNTFVTQMTDNNQKALSIKEDETLGSQHPYFTSGDIIDYLQAMNVSSDVNVDNGLQYAYRNNFFGYNRAMLTCKLLDYLGYGKYYKAVTTPRGGVVDTSPSEDDNYPDLPDYNVQMNPFPLLAYQKIYSDYYRNSQWEKAYAPAFNIDYMNGNYNTAGGDGMHIYLQDLDYSAENMMDLRYCNWNKDYFMGVLPNSQYGNEASVDLSSIVSPAVTTYSFYNSGNASKDVSTNSNGYLVAGTSPNWTINADNVRKLASGLGLTPERLSSAFTVLALRQAEAAQKWREITQSAQQDYKSQIEAHFGVNVSDAYSDRCKFIDGQVNTIDINEVVNQSLQGDNQASIKGKGVGTGDGYITFETKVHGYLMCVYHAVPVLDYQVTGYSKTNLKTMVTDYAIPEFDRTGMVKIPLIELSNQNIKSDTGGIIPDTHVNVSRATLGYAPQYYEYKTRFDEVKGAFAHGGLGAWVSPFSQNYLNEYFTSLIRTFGTDQFSIEYHFFKINPNILNPIFVGQIDPEYLSSSESYTDQLLINCSLDVKAVRNLDRNGLPY